MTFGITLRGCVSAERLACCIERERERDYCTERIGVDFSLPKPKNSIHLPDSIVFSIDYAL